MIETNTPQAAVRDPVCGMEIDPTQAFATRSVGEEMFYFCSLRCVEQFDREHTGSATTGVSVTDRLQRIDIPVTDWNGRKGAAYLEEQLLTLPGVTQVSANPKTNLVRISYDSSQTD